MARNLRMFGLDAELLDSSLSTLVTVAMEQGRCLITRRGTSNHSKSWPVPVMEILDESHEAQLIQVLKSLPQPVPKSRWFRRCLLCNTKLKDISREEAAFRVPDHVALSHVDFKNCTSCGRIYWPGTHRENMLKNMQRWCLEAWGVVPQD